MATEPLHELEGELNALEALRVRHEENAHKWNKNSSQTTHYRQTGVNVTREMVRQELIRYLMRKKTIKEISKLMGMNSNTIRRFINAEGFVDELKQACGDAFVEIDEQIKLEQKTVQERMEELQMQALDTLEDLMEKANDTVRHRAADSVLDRMKDTAKNVKSDTTNTLRIDHQFLMLAASAANEIDTGIVIEGEK